MRLTRILLAVLVAAIAVPLVAVLMTSWSRGWTLADVETGSMRPGLRPGSMVVLEPIDPSAVRAGMIVGFRDDRRHGAVTTHRVVAVLKQPSGLFFTTQGDANARPDGEPVPARAIVGKVRWRVTGLGALATAATRHDVQVGVIAIPLGLLGLSEGLGLLGRRRDRSLKRLQEEIDRLEAELAATREQAAQPPVRPPSRRRRRGLLHRASSAGAARRAARRP